MVVEKSEMSVDIILPSDLVSRFVLAVILTIFVISMCKVVYDAFATLKGFQSRAKLRIYSLSDLRQFDGQHGDGPILIAVGGCVYDVCRDRHIFGPTGQYSSFAGRDITINLLILTAALTENEHIDVDNVDLWRFYFDRNYRLVGKLDTHPRSSII